MTGPRPVNTFWRVISASRHVWDLRVIWGFGFAITFVVFVYFVLLVFIFSPIKADPSHPDPYAHEWTFLCGSLGVMVGLTGWAYQTASSRLGAIDLFGCEISALCRVFWVVDFAHGTVAWLGRSKKTLEQRSWQPKGIRRSPSEPNEQPKRSFTSEEDYTPVYNNRLSDLQPLSADVVTSITEFYTYRKTMMDYLRMVFKETEGTEAHVRCLRQMLYMQFLMYESGRKAVERLIEFEPNQAESLISIYCLELISYQCLTKEYEELNRGNPPGAYEYLVKRLGLRKLHYCNEVPELWKHINRQDEKDIYWEKAKTSNAVLKKCFDEVFKGHADNVNNPLLGAAPQPTEPLSINRSAEAVFRQA